MHMERKQFTAVSGDSVDDNVGDKVSHPPIQFNAKADSGKSNNLCVQHNAEAVLFIIVIVTRDTSLHALSKKSGKEGPRLSRRIPRTLAGKSPSDPNRSRRMMMTLRGMPRRRMESKI